jgi:hypothetical protein
MDTMNLNEPIEGMTPLFSAPPAPEKNISKPQMDSTPIGDIMGGGGEDSMGAPFQAQPPMYQQMPQQMPQQQQMLAKKNPMNLTDDQLEALLAGAVAVIAFSGAAQDKLAGMLPQMLDASGVRSNLGLAVTALIAALLFYFIRPMVIKR